MNCGVPPRTIDSKSKLTNPVMPELVPKMTRLPLTEEEAMEMARKWSDKVFRGRQVTEWVQFALKKYAEVSEEARAARE